MWFGRESRVRVIYFGPMMTRTLFLLLAFAVLGMPRAYGQLGVVWDAPVSERAAMSDLVEMRMLGLRAVRTGPVTERGILAAADSMGMMLYRDIGLERLSPGEWADTLLAAVGRVDALAASPYPGWIGLGSWTATNLPATCEWIGSLAQRVHSAGHKAYYITPFTRRDRCRHVVDAVLVDGLGRVDPGELVDAFRARDAVGVASVGVASVGVASAGLAAGAGGSMEQHGAVFIERILTLSRDYVVFLHRWRDRPDADPWAQPYGLYDANGNPRAIVGMLREAHLTGKPIFARGPEVDVASASWSVLVGWLLIVFLAMLYATSPRFRQMIPRYFLAHGFYRNAVREAREVLPLTSTALISLIGLSTGLVVAVVLHGLHDRPIGRYIYGLLPEGTTAAASALMGTPFVLSILLGSVILLSLAVWMSMWVLLTGRQHPLLASQALMLAVWPRWQAVALVPVAMVLGPPGTAATYVLVATGLVFAASLVWSAIRTANDMSRVSRVSRPLAVLLVLLNPEVLFVLAGVVLASAKSAHARMIWDLLSAG